MPKLGEAYVNIRANLAPLKRGLSMAKGVVAGSLSIISKAAMGGISKVIGTVKNLISSITNIIKKAIQKIV